MRKAVGMVVVGTVSLSVGVFIQFGLPAALILFGVLLVAAGLLINLETE